MWFLGRLVALLLILLPTSVASAQPLPPGNVIHVNGIDLHYIDRGKGEPLLLVHGFNSCAADWGSIADALAQDYRLIIPDLRGHGWSTGPASSFSMPRASDDISALLNSLGLRRVRAIGLSAGSIVLLHLATREQDRISSMILVSSVGQLPDQARAILRGTTIATLPDVVRDRAKSCAAHGEDQMREIVDRVRAYANDTEDVNFSAAQLHTIRAGTLLVQGDRDRLFPVEYTVKLYRDIPNSELWIVPGGGHVPIFGDRKPEFLRVAREFLSRQPSH
jgi:pimeloyl-ACP methyl ester carboxylesterase